MTGVKSLARHCLAERDAAGLTEREFATLNRSGALKAVKRQHERKQQSASPLLDERKAKLVVECGVLPESYLARYAPEQAS